MAPRSVWKGSLSFGMVSIPIKLYSAVEDQAVRFNTLHKPCGKRVQMPLYCPNCETRVERDDTVKGYPVTEEQWVVVEDKDLQSLPLKSIKAIEVVRFVDDSNIDPRHYEKPYFMAPEGPGAKAFALLLMGMGEASKVALARVTMREREHMCAIRPFGRVMLLQTLYWVDELRDHEAVAMELPTPSEKEITMAVSLIRAMEGVVNLDEFQDNYRLQLVKLIEAKLAGKVLEAALVEEPKPTDDVLAALMASIEAMKATKAA